MLDIPRCLSEDYFYQILKLRLLVLISDVIITLNQPLSPVCSGDAMLTK